MNEERGLFRKPDIIRKPVTIWERFPELGEIPPEGFPKHIVIVPDGNRRYAKDKGKMAIQGHIDGAKVTRNILKDLKELPIPFVTFWAFSSDNWQRPPEEVKALMMLLDRVVNENLNEVQEYQGRIKHIGRKDRIPNGLKNTLDFAENITRNNPGQTICLAIDYGGRDEIARMMEKARNLPKDVPITEETVELLKDGGTQVPQADLFIRTSEQRQSGFGLLVGPSTEFHFIKDKFYPEIGTQDIVSALVDFSQRQRRFGK